MMNGKIGDGDGLLRAVSPVTNTIKTTTISEDFFVNGVAFSCRHVIVIPNGNGTEVWIDPSAYTPPTGFAAGLIVLTPVFSASTGPVIISAYFGATYTLGAGSYFSCINRDSAAVKQTADTKNILNPTMLTAGLKKAEFLVAASAAQGSFSGIGATSSGNLPLRIPLTPTRLIFDNTSGANSTVEFNFTWFEV